MADCKKNVVIKRLQITSIYMRYNVELLLSFFLLFLAETHLFAKFVDAMLTWRFDDHGAW